MYHHHILRIVSKMLIPPILLFALYVQFHGDFGPGGGFQAGVIFAVAYILYALVYGLDRMQKVLPPVIVRIMAALGLLLYAGTGVASLFLGHPYLDYAALAHDAQHGQHLGIMLVEFGVGTTVSAVMILIFSAFADRPPAIEDRDW
jgi:multicomponent Na+:H+ antiporter subunit B